MIRKFVVNGTEYDSPDAMPPDVRREYERALRLVADMGKGGGPSGTTDKTAETRQDGVSVKRSEEHTSELQSQSNLVCRLLLEKKKLITINVTIRTIKSQTVYIRCNI